MVYGGDKTFRNKACAFSGNAAHLRGEIDNGPTGDKNGQIGQHAEEGVSVIADLERLNAARETAGAIGGQCRGFQIGAGKYFQRQEDQEYNRHCSPTIHIPLLVMILSAIVKNCSLFLK